MRHDVLTVVKLSSWLFCILTICVLAGGYRQNVSPARCHLPVTENGFAAQKNIIDLKQVVHNQTVSCSDAFYLSVPCALCWNAVSRDTARKLVWISKLSQSDKCRADVSFFLCLNPTKDSSSVTIIWKHNEQPKDVGVGGWMYSRSFNNSLSIVTVLWHLLCNRIIAIAELEKELGRKWSWPVSKCNQRYSPGQTDVNCKCKPA